MAVTFEKSGIHLEFLEPGKVRDVWPCIRNLIVKLEKKACHGEFSADDVFTAAIQGEIGIGVARDKNGIFMIMVFEDVYYPKAHAVNVLGMAGERLDEFMTLFLGPFKDALKERGVAWIECSVSPGMERMHQRYGFRPIYRKLRLEV